MFKVSASPEFSAPVVAFIPAEKGAHTRISFTARFHRMPTSEFDALIEQINAARDAPEAEKPSDQALVERVTAGWSEVQDEEGQPLEFNLDNLRMICDIHPVRSCIARAFLDTYTKAPTKNSKP